MTRRRKPNTRLRRDTARATPAVQEATDLIASGGFIDDDDALYRPLTGQRGSNLPAFKHEQSVQIAKYLFRTNPTGNRLISLLTDFVLGEGATLSFRNSQVEQVVMRHWDDPYNNWDRAMTRYFQNYLIFGELLMPLFPNPANGHLRIGLQLAENIKSVKSDAENWMIPETVTMKPPQPGEEGRTYRIVNVRETRDGLIADGEDDRPALFWTRENPFGNRGVSTLYAIADLLDLHEQFMYSEVERSFLLKAFVWIVTMQGATEAEINAAIKSGRFNPPKTGSVIVTNEKQQWSAANPNLNSSDAWNGLTKLRNHLLGAQGIPEHWYSEGGDVNRATAAEMSPPALKRMTMLQKEWLGVVNDVIRAQLDYAINAKVLDEQVPVEKDGEATEQMVSVYDAYTLSMPDLSPTDNAAVVTTLQILTSTLALAEDQEYITKHMARVMWATVATQIGVEIDVADEEETLKADEEEQINTPQAQNPPLALVQRQEERVAAAGGA